MLLHDYSDQLDNHVSERTLKI